jgi:hypothetical protein
MPVMLASGCPQVVIMNVLMIRAASSTTVLNGFVPVKEAYAHCLGECVSRPSHFSRSGTLRLRQERKQHRGDLPDGLAAGAS